LVDALVLPRGYGARGEAVRKRKVRQSNFCRSAQDCCDCEEHEQADAPDDHVIAMRAPGISVERDNDRGLFASYMA
jgi:hypothetical protein